MLSHDDKKCSVLVTTIYVGYLSYMQAEHGASWSVFSIQVVIK